MTTISSLNKSVGNIIDKYASRKSVRRIFEKGIEHPAKFAAGMMVASIVSKDAINCVIYTYQSYNNQRIPKERRPFVAALDFTNGIINVLGQIAAFYAVERFFTPKLIAKLFTGVYKDPKTGKEFHKHSTSPLSSDEIRKTVANVIKNEKEELEARGTTPESAMQHLNELSEQMIKNSGHGSKRAKELAEGLGLIVGALATMALIKRTLTPLIATPMADYFKNNFDSNRSKEQGPKDPRLEKAIAQAIYQDNKTPDSGKAAFKSLA